VAPNAEGSDARSSVPPTLHAPRPAEGAGADEPTLLRAWLTFQRESVIYKLEGLDDEQLRWRPASSANSLGGIATHLAYGERFWFRAVFAGEPLDLSFTDDRFAMTFDVPDGASAAEVIAFYRAESRAADAAIDVATSLDQRSVGELRPTTLRWVLAHEIEETARHAGHMDITRELIDGLVGR